jgi:hypothetical protein
MYHSILIIHPPSYHHRLPLLLRHDLALLHLGRNVQYPLAPRDLVQSTHLQPSEDIAANNPKECGDCPDLGVFLDGAGDGEVVGGLDDGAHDGNRRVCLMARRIGLDVEYLKGEVVHLKCGAVGG